MPHRAAGAITTATRPVGRACRTTKANTQRIQQTISSTKAISVSISGIDILRRYNTMISEMKTISLNLPEGVLEESGKAANTLQLSRAAYIRKAIERMNHETAARI